MSEHFTTKSAAKLHNLQSLFSLIQPAELKGHRRHQQLCEDWIKKLDPNRSQSASDWPPNKVTDDEFNRKPRMTLATSLFLKFFVMTGLNKRLAGLGSATLSLKTYQEVLTELIQASFGYVNQNFKEQCRHDAHTGIT